MLCVMTYTNSIQKVMTFGVTSIIPCYIPIGQFANMDPTLHLVILVLHFKDITYFGMAAASSA